jgi:hypothetical protein
MANERGRQIVTYLRERSSVFKLVNNIDMPLKPRDRFKQIRSNRGDYYAYSIQVRLLFAVWKFNFFIEY